MKVGFLGAGAMGGAILSGGIASNVLNPSDVFVCDMSDAIKEKYKALGCNICESNAELGEKSDVVILAVKPQYAKDALSQLGNSLENKAAISIMAGLTQEAVSSMIDSNTRIMRVMPNTPALVNLGAFALCKDNTLNEDEIKFSEELFSSIGIVEWLNESLIDPVTGLSGAGPAYVYMMIEALADGGVLEGLPRNTALKLAAQTVMGAAKMVLETGEHPGALKDKVCSPGGNTIVGVKTMEEHGVRGALIDTVHKATARARELGKK